MRTKHDPLAGLRGWVVAAVATGTLAGGCVCPRGDAGRGSVQPPVYEQLVPTAMGNDCQQDSVYIIVHMDSTHLADTIITAASMPLVRDIANLPEYHDCQRFVVPNPRATRDTTLPKERYGPLVAIWAASKVDTLFGRDSATDAMPTPVAVIYNFERAASYDTLGIAPGFSCLYLWKAMGWHARIVPLGSTPAGCEERRVSERALSIGKDLPVRPAPLDRGLTPEDVPAVARWDWDDKHGTQYIGIRCGDKWCEVGPKGFAPSAGVGSSGMTPEELRLAIEPIPGVTDPKGTAREVTRLVTVKGWYDQQAMDLRDASGKPVLTDVRGTVLPHPALARVPDDAYRQRWVPVAYLHVTADYPGVVPLEKGINRLALCEGSLADCGIPSTPTCKAPGTGAGPTWWARVTSPSGAVAFRCITKRDHAGMAIPAAAARWNWHEYDATTWIKCQQGCCTVN